MFGQQPKSAMDTSAVIHRIVHQFCHHDVGTRISVTRNLYKTWLWYVTRAEVSRMIENSGLARFCATTETQDVDSPHASLREVCGT
jgi:hypothetical protein